MFGRWFSWFSNLYFEFDFVRLLVLLGFGYKVSFACGLDCLHVGRCCGFVAFEIMDCLFQAAWVLLLILVCDTKVVYFIWSFVYFLVGVLCWVC